MPNRYLRESILFSRTVNDLTAAAEVFYRRLMSIVDDFGRTEADSVILLSKLFPFRSRGETEADICIWLAECERLGLISLYVAESRKYILFHKLGEPRAKYSKCPPPPSQMQICAQTNAHANTCAQTKTFAPPAPTPTPAPAPAPTPTPTPKGERGVKPRSPDEGESRKPEAGSTSPDARQPTAITTSKPEARSDTKTRRQPTGSHAELIAHFTDRWEARYGAKFPFSAKDAAHAKWILNQVSDLEQAKSAVDAYLAANDEFYERDRHGLGLLVAQFRRFIVPKKSATKATEIRARMFST